MKTRCPVLVPAVLAAAALAAGACARESPPEPAASRDSAGAPGATAPVQVPAPPAVLRYGLAAIPAGLDRRLWSASQLGILHNNVHETLVRAGEGGRFEPSLAESWQVSADRRTYEFRLHPGVTFHDGTRFDAQAVKANLDRLADPSTGSRAAASLLHSYRAATVTDPYTVLIRLEKPDPAFLNALAGVHLGIASPAGLASAGRDRDRISLAGTGPFTFLAEEYVPGRTIVLRKNPDYRWGPSSYRDVGALYFGSGYDPNSSCLRAHLVYEHTGPAYLDRIIFTSIPDPAARARALETAEVDAADDLVPADAARLEGQGRFWMAPDALLFRGARKPVNCLTYDAGGGGPILYDAAVW